MGLLARVFNKTPRWVRKLNEREGFHPATIEETYGATSELKTLADAKQHTGESLVNWAQEAERLSSSGAVLPWGVPVEATIGRWPSSPPTLAFEERREDHVKPFAEAYASHPTPMTAVMFSEACFDAAWDARGTDWASNVSEKNWAIFAKWNQRGEEALLAEAASGSSSLAWLTQAYSAVARSPQDYGQLNDAFHRAFEADAHNLHLLREHGQFLLPRWYGSGPEALEEFARWATEVTSDRFGNGAYAYIYGACPNVGELESSQTHCDPRLLDEGYRDLRERFPSNRLLNEHANALFWAGDYEGVVSLFSGGLKAIDVTAWGGDNEAEGLERAATAFKESTSRVNH